MKLCTRVYDGLEGMEPFEVQNIRDGVKMELYYMNDTPFVDEYTRKAEFAVFSTKDGLTYRLMVEKGYYEVMHELYDVEVNTIWEQYWVDINRCRKNYLYKILVPILLVCVGISYLVIYLTKNNIWALLACIFGMFLATSLLNGWNKGKMQKINYEAGNKIREAKGIAHFEALAKEQEKYYAKFFGYEDELKNESEENLEEIDDEIEKNVESNVINSEIENNEEEEK